MLFSLTYYGQTEALDSFCSLPKNQLYLGHISAPHTVLTHSSVKELQKNL